MWSLSLVQEGNGCQSGAVDLGLVVGTCECEVGSVVDSICPVQATGYGLQLGLTIPTVVKSCPDGVDRVVGNLLSNSRKSGEALKVGVGEKYSNSEIA